jgi:hypothetical protein
MKERRLRAMTLQGAIEKILILWIHVELHSRINSINYRDRQGSMWNSTAELTLFYCRGRKGSM